VAYILAVVGRLRYAKRQRQSIYQWIINLPSEIYSRAGSHTAAGGIRGGDPKSNGWLKWSDQDREDGESVTLFSSETGYLESPSCPSAGPTGPITHLAFPDNQASEFLK